MEKNCLINIHFQSLDSISSCSSKSFELPVGSDKVDHVIEENKSKNCQQTAVQKRSSKEGESEDELEQMIKEAEKKKSEKKKKPNAKKSDMDTLVSLQREQMEYQKEQTQDFAIMMQNILEEQRKEEREE